jgi:hypothetical protein
MIMALNIPDTKKNNIRVKLESAFMFWELDYVAMDFSPDLNLKPEIIYAANAMNSLHNYNETENISKIDSQYSTILQDDFLAVEFEVPATATSKNSYFLVSTGYYHSLKQYDGKADLAELNHFKKKGYFSAYSEYKFTAVKNLLAKGIDLQYGSNFKQK